MIEALIFDFDGVILETEGPIFQTWQEVYESYGCRFSEADWADVIGTDPIHFDPFASLEAQLGHKVDRVKVQARRRQREQEIVNQQPILPGVVEYLENAQKLGLKVGLASSSDYAWVGGHLSRLDLLKYFDVIRTCDDVENAKPAPDLFLAALKGLMVTPEQAIVLEDSYNGLLAAQQAGIFCVAVPTEMTRNMPLGQAGLRIDSLASLPLKDLINQVEQIKAGCPDRIQ